MEGRSPQRENLIVLRTFNKWAGLAGLRVGYGAFPAWLMPTRYGEFDLIAFSSDIEPQPHLALCKGGVGALDHSGQTIA
ncbi:MAG TPA: hypothetical protein EYP88_04145, partial [Anaerolineales bacterium]|nr:hypothetical protein [Anaerolineales bacterium]